MEEADVEELITLMVEFYQAFKDVLEKGTLANKVFALKEFNRMKEMMSEKLAQFSERKEMTMKEMNQAIEQRTMHAPQHVQEGRRKLILLQKQIEPLIEKLYQELNIEPQKKRSKLRRHKGTKI